MTQNINLSVDSSKKLRSSNLELLRIITMILIIAHHYVVNSNLSLEIQTDPRSINSIFLNLFSMWGKTGINCYLLITGYFMCKSQISLTKFIKLWLEVVFYGVVIYLLFFIGGYYSFKWVDLFLVLVPINYVTNNFVGCFLLFYLFIPFLNILIRGMNKQKHACLILLCLFIYTFLATLFIVTMNYITCFIIIYLIASYIRLYQVPYSQSKVFWGCMTLLSVMISCFTVLYRVYFNLANSHKFLSDPNAIMAVVTSICIFMFFKNINIKYNKWINTLAASTFGVLLIHINSEAIRQWLWVDTLKNVEIWQTNYMFIHFFISVLGVFIICTIVDQMRIHFLETPLFKKIGPLIERLNTKLIRKMNE